MFNCFSDRSQFKSIDSIIEHHNDEAVSYDLFQTAPTADAAYSANSYIIAHFFLVVRNDAEEKRNVTKTLGIGMIVEYGKLKKSSFSRVSK